MGPDGRGSRCSPARAGGTCRGPSQGMRVGYLRGPLPPMLVRCLALFVLTVARATPALAQPTLTVDLITQDPDTWIGAWPSGLFWTEAGDAAYFSWNPRGAMPSDSLYRVTAQGRQPDVGSVTPSTSAWLALSQGGQSRGAGPSNKELLLHGLPKRHSAERLRRSGQRSSSLASVSVGARGWMT